MVSAAIAGPATASSLPSPHSAGVTAGTTLRTKSGDYSIRSSANISGLHITGSLYITGSNVTVSNVQVDGGIFINRTAGGGYVSPVPSNIVLSHVTGHNISSLGFNGLTLDAVNLANSASGPHARLTNYSANGVSYPASKLTIQNSWFHGVLSTTTGTIESLHLSGVQGASINNNEFSAVAPDAATQARTDATVMLDATSYGQFNNNIVLGNNALYGGGYFQMYFDGAGSNAVTNNQFHSGGSLFAGVQYPPSQYSASQVPAGGYDYFSQSGNTLDSSAVSLPGGTAVTPPPSPTTSPSPTTTTSSSTPTPSPTTTTSSSTPTSSPTPTPTSTTTSPAPAPNPTSAGIIPGSTLTPVSGDVWLSANNQNYSNKHISGTLFITGSNVTVSNVQVDGAVQINRTPGGGYFSPVPSNISLSHVATTGIFTIGFNGLTLDAVNVSNAQNAPHAQIYCYLDSNSGIMYPASNFVMKNSWFHGFLPSTTSAHLENLHLGCVHGATITNNQFELYSPDGSNTLSHFTANITLDAELFGAWNSDVTIRNNVLKGGSYYQLYYCSSGANNDVSGNSFDSSNNPIFAGIQYPPSQYSSSSLPNGTYTKFTQSANTLNGTGTSLPGGM